MPAASRKVRPLGAPLGGGEFLILDVLFGFVLFCFNLDFYFQLRNFRKSVLHESAQVPKLNCRCKSESLTCLASAAEAPGSSMSDRPKPGPGPAGEPSPGSTSKRARVTTMDRVISL